jgi:PAS domain-containing protein
MKMEPALAGAHDEGRFQLLVQSVHDYAIYMLDPKGYVSSWNSGAQRFKGYAPSEIIGEGRLRIGSRRISTGNETRWFTTSAEPACPKRFIK